MNSGSTAARRLVPVDSTLTGQDLLEILSVLDDAQQLTGDLLEGDDGAPCVDLAVHADRLDAAYALLSRVLGRAEAHADRLPTPTDGRRARSTARRR